MVTALRHLYAHNKLNENKCMLWIKFTRFFDKKNYKKMSFKNPKTVRKWRLLLVLNLSQ